MDHLVSETYKNFLNQVSSTYPDSLFQACSDSVHLFSSLGCPYIHHILVEVFLLQPSSNCSARFHLLCLTKISAVTQQLHRSPKTYLDYHRVTILTTIFNILPANTVRRVVLSKCTNPHDCKGASATEVQIESSQLPLTRAQKWDPPTSWQIPTCH